MKILKNKIHAVAHCGIHLYCVVLQVGCATVLWFRATVEVRAAQHQGWQRTEAYEESRNLLEMFERRNMFWVCERRYMFRVLKRKSNIYTYLHIYVNVHKYTQIIRI